MNGGKRRRSRQDRRKKNKSKKKAEPLKFKESTPAPFLINLVLDGGNEEGGEDDQKHCHEKEKERSGVVGAWEEDGTLWRSHDPPPSKDHNVDHEIPRMSHGSGKQQPAAPSSSLLPPNLLQESFVQAQIRVQQEATLRKRQQEELRREQQEAVLRKEQQEELRRAEIIQSEEEDQVVQPLMRLVEAVFNRKSPRPREHMRAHAPHAESRHVSQMEGAHEPHGEPLHTSHAQVMAIEKPSVTNFRTQKSESEGEGEGRGKVMTGSSQRTVRGKKGNKRKNHRGGARGKKSLKPNNVNLQNPRQAAAQSKGQVNGVQTKSKKGKI